MNWYSFILHRDRVLCVTMFSNSNFPTDKQSRFRIYKDTCALSIPTFVSFVSYCMVNYWWQLN